MSWHPEKLGEKDTPQSPMNHFKLTQNVQRDIKINDHRIHTSLFLCRACPLPPRNGSCNPFRIPPPPPHPHHPHRDRRCPPLFLVPALAPIMVSCKVHNESHESQTFLVQKDIKSIHSSCSQHPTAPFQAFPSHKESVSSHCRFIT